MTTTTTSFLLLPAVLQQNSQLQQRHYHFNKTVQVLLGANSRTDQTIRKQVVSAICIGILHKLLLKMSAKCDQVCAGLRDQV